MKQKLFRKHISFLMVVVLFTISLTGFCRSAHSFELSADSHNAKTGSYLSAIEKSCPCSPVDENAVPDHCDSSCNCPCHAPLSGQPVQLISSQLVAPLEFHENFQYIPEVFLSRFIPPQNRA